ncbi:hypothetical protein [Bacteroides sp. 2_2_4]|uniref:hypothetical protein n=1 Tax=Bacteroides sp. 2_2_4 TaxID=469590 RepID=UPI000518C912|nr:hypothetical protein [Bacteroides sp. 2_2_4]
MVQRFYKEKTDGFILDDRHEILSLYISQCARCKHFMEDDYYCSAYPDGIPDRLLEGSDTHDVIQPDQVGNTLYEPED